MSGAAEFCYGVLRDIAGGRSQPQADLGAWFDRHRRPRLRYWVVAPTYKLLAEARSWVMKFVPRELWAADYFKNDDELWLRHPTGRGFVCIGFRSADNPHALVSAGVDGMLLDEAARIPRAAYEQSLYTRLVLSNGWCVLNTSPFGGKGCWVYELLIAKADEDPEIEAFNLLAKDNPAMPIEAIQSAKRHLPPMFYRRDFEGDWSTFGAQIFDEWDPKVHVVSEKQLCLEYGLGVGGNLLTIARRVHYGADFGLRDPTALVAVLETTRDEFIVADEWVRSEAPFIRPENPDGSIIGEAWNLQRRWNKGTWHCDHNGHYGHEFTRHGLNAMPAYKDIDKGVRVLATVLHGDGKRPRLRVVDKCKHVIKEFGTLAWDQDSNGKVIEGKLDDKVPNDASDAVRYALAHLYREIFDQDGIPRRTMTNTLVGFGSWQSQQRY